MNKFKVGDKVRVKEGIEEPEYKWGALRYSDRRQVGVVRGIQRGYIEINFPSQSYWKALPEEMELANRLVLENK